MEDHEQNVPIFYEKDCAIHGKSLHTPCDYCGIDVCTVCAYEGKILYFLFMGTHKNCVVVGCKMGTHGKFVKVSKVPT